MLQCGSTLNMYVKWNKPDTKKKNTVWLYLYEVPGMAKFLEIESGLQGLG